jgi:hypothetical protein
MCLGRRKQRLVTLDALAILSMMYNLLGFFCTRNSISEDKLLEETHSRSDNLIGSQVWTVFARWS